MFKKKFIISISIFITFLVITSIIKNKTHILEKQVLNLNIEILEKKKDINEAQLDFYYLTSPAEIEKKINLIGFNDYHPIKYSNIFFNIADFTHMNSKISNIKTFNEKKIKNK